MYVGEIWKCVQEQILFDDIAQVFEHENRQWGHNDSSVYHKFVDD